MVISVKNGKKENTKSLFHHFTVITKEPFETMCTMLYENKTFFIC